MNFKIIDIQTADQLGGNLDRMRRNAEVTGPGFLRKIEIDISCNEFCEPKRAIEIDDYTVFVYTPLLLVCEKLRAICQQLAEYDPIVRRQRSTRTRYNQKSWMTA